MPHIFAFPLFFAETNECVYLWPYLKGDIFVKIKRGKAKNRGASLGNKQKVIFYNKNKTIKKGYLDIIIFISSTKL